MQTTQRLTVAVPFALVALTSLGGCSGEDPDLTGTWKASMVYPAYPETTYDPSTGARAVVEFRNDGTLTADDGCADPYSGTYELGSDGDFEAGDLTDEEVVCDGQVSWDEILRFTERVSVDGDEATFADGDGNPLAGVGAEGLSATAGPTRMRPCLQPGVSVESRG